MNQTHPIAAAVNPMRQAAIDHAVEVTTAWLADVCAGIESGADLNVVAPYPRSNMSRRDYLAAQAYRNLITRLFETTREGYLHTSPVIIGERRPDSAKAILAQAAADAAASFDAYVAKLTGKIGDCTSAEVSGLLWFGSTLTVTKNDGTTQRWNTKQIVNCSILGKLFNQWPTRQQK